MIDRQRNIRISTGMLLTIHAVQAGAFAALGLYGLFHVKLLAATGYFLQLGIVGVVVVSSTFAGFVSWRCRGFAIEGERQTRLLSDTLESAESLNQRLRAQRHDFLNHLQVVYGLMEMDEYAEARAYIERVYGDIQEVSRMMRTANAAVNALLAAKQAAAEKRGISFDVGIGSRLDGLPVPAWEMCRILGNLFDNAMDALEGRKGAAIGVELREDIRSFSFRVTDNGHGIPEDDLERIFRPGYSTRGRRDGHGEGMGLPIVRELVEQFGGTVQVESEPGRTVFTCCMPKAPAPGSLADGGAFDAGDAPTGASDADASPAGKSDAGATEVVAFSSGESETNDT